MEWKVDAFTFDNGISSDLLFGDTSLSSLSPEITHTVSSTFNRTNLDDGLRTPELVVFSADDYSNNCEILNQQLLTDVNPSLQVTTHNMIDSPNIENSLLENHCNSSELGKNESFQQKEMDISFYSNLDSIPEIPGISCMKSIENNFDTSKSLESLFEMEKEISNLSCINDIKKDNENIEIASPESSVTSYHKIIDDDYKLSNDRTNNIYSSQNSSSQDISIKNYEFDESVQSKNNFKDEINYNLNTKDENDLSGLHMNYFLNSENSLSSKSIQNDKDVENSIFTISEDNSDSIEAISAAEFTIYQMIEAISDNSQITELTDNLENDANKIESSKIKPIISEELIYHNKNSETTNVYISAISKELNEMNHFSEEHIEIEFVPHDDDDDENNQNDKYEIHSILESNDVSNLFINDTELFKITNLDCFVSLERLDESFVRNLNTTKKHENKLNCHKSKSSKLNIVNVSKNKPKCKVCKRYYASLASLEIHKCKKRKSIQFPSFTTDDIFQQTPTSDKHFVCNICNKSFNEIDSLQSHFNNHYINRKEIHCFDLENKDLSSVNEKIMRKNNSRFDFDQDLLHCQKCQQTFHNYSVLIQHLCYMHSNHFKQCEFCKHKFKSGGNIMNHMSHHINNKVYNCNYCSFNSSFHKELDEHISMNHNSLKNEHDVKNDIVELKPCSVQLEVLDLKMS